MAPPCLLRMGFIKGGTPPPAIWMRLPHGVGPRRTRCLQPSHSQTEPQGGRQHRTYLTCAVRLSPEKEVATFISLTAHLHATGALLRLNLTPLLLGSASSPYADKLKQRFQREVPTGIIEQRFLGPADLAGIFAATRLNVHPCRYDAYGMTIIEAASQGAPSVMQQVQFRGSEVCLSSH
jgi:hypothetical protein